MMKKMSRIAEEEKMEMLSRMMRSTESTSCIDMMPRMSTLLSNDSLPKSEMASLMLPVCVGDIILEVKENQRSEFLLALP